MNSLFGQPLSVLNVGLASFADAIAQRGGWSAQGRSLWWLKDRIDRRWIASFR